MSNSTDIVFAIAKCYYSFDAIGKMGRSKPALTVIYENERFIPERSYRTLKNAYKIFHERYQTQFEFSCAASSGRTFGLYTYFFKDYESTEELCMKVIDDDIYLASNTEAARDFTVSFNKALELYGHKKHKKSTVQFQLSFS